MIITMKLRIFCRSVFFWILSLTKLSKVFARIECGFQKDINPINIDDWLITGSPPDASFLCATSDQGLLLIENKNITRLIQGKFYGITRWSEGWLVVIQKKFYCCIWSINLETKEKTPVCWGLPRGVHLIDWHNNKLYITDTYNNCVGVISHSQLSSGKHWNSAIKYYPDGELTNGRLSTNYRHFNYVFVKNSTIYLVAHNETAKTGRSSELFELDFNFTLLNRSNLSGSSCHNVAFIKNSIVFCNSLEGTVCVGDKNVVKTNMFTRGLSISSNCYVVGTSSNSRLKSNRLNGVSEILMFDEMWNFLAKYYIPKSQICEIRRIDQADYGLSQNVNIKQKRSEILKNDK